MISHPWNILLSKNHQFLKCGYIEQLLSFLYIIIAAGWLNLDRYRYDEKWVLSKKNDQKIFPNLIKNIGSTLASYLENLSGQLRHL